MNYVILLKSIPVKGFTRTRKGRLERIHQYSRVGVKAEKFGKFVRTGDKDFDRFATDVRQTIPKEYPYLLKQANDYLPHTNLSKVRVYRVELSGSYRKGNPKQDSDIDIKVYYFGEADPSDVSMTLAGNIVGNYGSYDIHAEKMKGL